MIWAQIRVIGLDNVYNNVPKNQLVMNADIWSEMWFTGVYKTLIQLDQTSRQDL